jgi:hypothetical protein
MKTPTIIASGWWVLIGAVVVSLLVVAAFIGDFLGPRSSDTPPFALEPSLVDADDLVTAMAPDGLRSLTSPAIMAPDEIAVRNEEQRGKVLVGSDKVIGVSINGETRAYPLRLLRWHEVVNDTVGGVAIAVTSSPLSGGIAVWDRRFDGREIEFGVSGMLLDSNTLLYDRRPDGGAASLWHQLTGEAVTGPAAGAVLTPLPASLETWDRWFADHPDTTIMAPDPDSKRLYKRDPYHSYRGSDVLRFPVEPLPPEGRLALKDTVAVVGTASHTLVFALPYLADAVGSARGRWVAPFGDDVVVIDFDAEVGTMAVASRDPEVLDPPVRYAYWFEWYALHPDAVPLP